MNDSRVVTGIHDVPLGRIDMPRCDGSELFRSGGAALPFTMLDFWRWSASDVVSNTMRGVLAEYIVGQAIGARGIDDAVREEGLHST